MSFSSANLRNRCKKTSLYCSSIFAIQTATVFFFIFSSFLIVHLPPITQYRKEYTNMISYIDFLYQITYYLTNYTTLFLKKLLQILRFKICYDHPAGT